MKIIKKNKVKVKSLTLTERVINRTSKLEKNSNKVNYYY